MASNPTQNTQELREGALDPADTRWLHYPVVRLLVAMRTGTVRKEIYKLTPDQCVKLKDDIENGRRLADTINSKFGINRVGPNIWDEVLQVIERRLKYERFRQTGQIRGDLFQRAKQVVDIVGFASKFTGLDSAGGSKMKGKCPIHEEKTASFYVDAERQSWRCFGACATGGDVIKLAEMLQSANKW